MVEDQSLSDGATLRVAEHGGGVNTELIEQARQGSGQLRRRVRWRKSATAPVTTEVRNDHTMPGCEMLDHRLEHLAGDHQSAHEQQRRRGSASVN
jgi:hypothetical protein